MFALLRRSALACVVLAALSGGCGPKRGGSVTPQGYQHAKYAYSVGALPGGTLMSGEWKLDNFYLKKEKLIEKDAAEYVISYRLDKNGDGEFETQAKQHLFDLRFENLVHDGVIFLRTFPISTDLGQKKLSVLMHDYIEGIAGGGYEVVQLNSEEEIVIEKRYAASIDSQGPAELAGLPAYVATLSVANTEQLKVDPNARAQRVQLVLLHTRFVYTHGAKGHEATFPVLLLAGYANQPDDFDAGLVDFQNLLNRVVLEGNRGFQYTPAAAAVARPAAPVAAPAPVAPAAPAPASAPAPESNPAVAPGQQVPASTPAPATAPSTPAPAATVPAAAAPAQATPKAAAPVPAAPAAAKSVK
jgi:hypothetical protein